jgi:hypothetical protein
MTKIPDLETKRFWEVGGKNKLCESWKLDGCGQFYNFWDLDVSKGVF